MNARYLNLHRQSLTPARAERLACLRALRAYRLSVANGRPMTARNLFRYYQRQRIASSATSLHC